MRNPGDMRRQAIFDAWLEFGRETYPRLQDFKRACDRGAYPELQPGAFDPPLDSEPDRRSPETP